MDLESILCVDIPVQMISCTDTEIPVSGQNRRTHYGYNRSSVIRRSGQKQSGSQFFMRCHGVWRKKDLYPLV